MRWYVQIGLFVSVTLGCVSLAHAQRPFRRTLTQYESRVTAEIDRNIQQTMNDAQQLIKQEQFAPAVMRLQTILDHSEDYFLNKDFSTKVTGHAGVKGQTHQILAELPAEGLATYERQFGTIARDRLNDAIAANDRARISDVISRYKMTAAGLEAMQILAAAAFDHDQMIEAATLCEAMTGHPRINRELSGPLLLQAAFAWQLAGQSEHSLTTLRELQKLQAPKLWRIGGRQVPPLNNDQDANQWLQTHFGAPVKPIVATVQQWSLPRGGLTGNESAAAACAAGGGAWSNSPLRYTRFMTSEEGNLRTQQEFSHLTRQIEQTLRDDNRLTQAAAIPVIVGDVVVYRTLNDVTAVHLRTGQLLWRSAMTDSMLAWLFQSANSGADNVSASAPTTFPGYLRHKLFRDQLSGSLSSDGQALYAIEESESQFNALRPRMRQGARYIPDPANKLVAYDLHGGRLLWEVGGVRGTPPVELSSIFFVCPPVPLNGRLYCLAEVRDELCILSLVPNGNTVKLDWSQTLINLNDAEAVIPPRRLAGAMPVFTDGMLVCPTTSGSIVAFDLVQKQLRWGYSYESPRNRNVPDVFEPTALFQVDEEEGRWLDGTPLIAAGRIIVTPRDSTELHCLSLVDGSLVWKRPRESGLYVACITDDAVIVVGRTQITACSLADGADVWTEPVEIPEPSGKGIRSGSRYLLPLSTGEIATLDMTAGRILGRSQLPERQIPGNLAIGSGTLVSLGVHDMIGFRPLGDVQQQIVRQLQNDPKHAEALALRGELRLHQGEERSAIEDLRESLRQQPQPRVERTLAATMLTVLKNDSGGLMRVAPELEKLTTDPRQRIEFLRLYSQALLESKDRAGALRQLFRLATMPQLSDDLVVVGRGYSVSQEQSIRSQLLSMDESASPADKSQIASELTREFQAAQAAENHDQRLTQFARLTFGLPVADQLLIKMSGPDQGIDTNLSRARLLERLTRSTVPSVAASAVATLADRSLAAKQPREALGWIDELRSRFPNEIALDGKTGRDLSESWLAREDVRESLTTESAWPAGTIDVERSRRARNQPTYAVDVVTHVGHHYVGWTFELDPTNGIFTARDPSMRIVWRLQFSNPSEFSRAQAAQLHIRGRHMAFSQGMVLAAIEATDLDPTPKILFEKSLRSTSPVDRRVRDMMAERHRLPNGRRYQSSFDMRGSAGFLVGLSDEAIFYQLDARLYAVDLETGRTLWTRTGPEFAKSDATVDQLLTLHTNKNDAILLRAVDGTIVSRHTGSLSEIPVWFGGTRRLSRRLDERVMLEMRDFDGDRVVWQAEYPAGTEFTVVEGNELATLEPSGKLTILNLTSGQTVITTDLPVSRAHGAGGVLAVQHSHNRYIVVAGVSSKKTETRTVTTLEFGPASDRAFTVDGCACAIDDKDGQLVWTVPIEQTAFDYTQSSQLPVLVLAARHSEFDQLGRFQLMPRLTAMVLDKRTGKTVYETEETSPINRGPQFTPLIDERKLIIDFQSWNLELTFASDPKTK